MGNVTREDDEGDDGDDGDDAAVGIKYGSDDRTGELRPYISESRHLGVMQMSTDTALLVAQMVLEGGKRLASSSSSNGSKGVIGDIPFVDSPAIAVDVDATTGKCEGREEVEMDGFRYVIENCEPVIPRGMREYWKKSLDDDILEEFY